MHKLCFLCLIVVALGCSSKLDDHGPRSVKSGERLGKVESVERAQREEVESVDKPERADNEATLPKEMWGGMLLTGSDGLMIHVGPPDHFDKALAWASLVAFLEHHDPKIRWSAANWLEGLGGSAGPAVPYLKRAIDDEDPKVHATILSALEKIDPDWRRRTDNVPEKAPSPKAWSTF